VPKKLLTQGIVRFAAEDGQEREVGIRLYSDETFQLMDESEAQAEKAKLFPTPASRRPDADDGPPASDKPFKLFGPPTQGKRMPNGLLNSSVPLPGHDIYYSEGNVRRK
jgi:hypothetical protein